mmetsp:Transcript_105747/g.166942  ORF Transcript_105747/g.166942 Transcript_105747/m.166942 type:complete len:173 (-) Transcript_105747:43-561(-)
MSHSNHSPDITLSASNTSSPATRTNGPHDYASGPERSVCLGSIVLPVALGVAILARCFLPVMIKDDGAGLAVVDTLEELLSCTYTVLALVVFSRHRRQKSSWPPVLSNFSTVQLPALEEAGLEAETELAIGDEDCLASDSDNVATENIIESFLPESVHRGLQYCTSLAWLLS